MGTYRKVVTDKKSGRYKIVRVNGSSKKKRGGRGRRPTVEVSPGLAARIKQFGIERQVTSRARIVTRRGGRGRRISIKAVTLKELPKIPGRAVPKAKAIKAAPKGVEALSGRPQWVSPAMWERLKAAKKPVPEQPKPRRIPTGIAAVSAAEVPTGKVVIGGKKIYEGAMPVQPAPAPGTPFGYKKGFFQRAGEWWESRVEKPLRERVTYPVGKKIFEKTGMTIPETAKIFGQTPVSFSIPTRMEVEPSGKVVIKEEIPLGPVGFLTRKTKGWKAFRGFQTELARGELEGLKEQPGKTAAVTAASFGLGAAAGPVGRALAPAGRALAATRIGAKLAPQAPKIIKGVQIGAGAIYSGAVGKRVLEKPKGLRARELGRIISTEAVPMTVGFGLGTRVGGVPRVKPEKVTGRTYFVEKAAPMKQRLGIAKTEIRVEGAPIRKYASVYKTDIMLRQPPATAGRGRIATFEVKKPFGLGRLRPTRVGKAGVFQFRGKEVVRIGDIQRGIGESELLYKTRITRAGKLFGKVPKEPVRAATIWEARPTRREGITFIRAIGKTKKGVPFGEMGYAIDKRTSLPVQFTKYTKGLKFAPFGKGKVTPTLPKAPTTTAVRAGKGTIQLTQQTQRAITLPRTGTQVSRALTTTLGRQALREARAAYAFAQVAKVVPAVALSVKPLTRQRIVPATAQIRLPQQITPQITPTIQPPAQVPPITIPTQTITTITPTITQPPFKPPVTPPAVPPPVLPPVIPIVPPALLLPPLFGRGRQKGAYIGAQEKEYTPSLTAQLFDIRGVKAPKVLTGLEIRPIIGGTKKKKRKRRKK